MNSIIATAAAHITIVRGPRLMAVKVLALRYPPICDMFFAGLMKPGWLMRWPSSLRQIAVSMTRPRWSSDAPERIRSRSGVSCGGEADAVARGAERLANRRDEPTSTRRTVRKFEACGRPWPRVGDRHEGEEVFDLFLDAPARHHLLVGPDAVAVKRHELDEANLVTLVAREAGEVHDLVVVVALHHDHV